MTTLLGAQDVLEECQFKSGLVDVVSTTQLAWVRIPSRMALENKVLDTASHPSSKQAVYISCREFHMPILGATPPFPTMQAVTPVDRGSSSCKRKTSRRRLGPAGHLGRLCSMQRFRWARQTLKDFDLVQRFWRLIGQRCQVLNDIPQPYIYIYDCKPESSHQTGFWHILTYDICYVTLD